MRSTTRTSRPLLTSLSLLVGLASLAAAAAKDPPAPLEEQQVAPLEEKRGYVVERIVAVVDDRVVLLSEVESVVDDIMRAEPPPRGVEPKAYRAARRREVLDTLIAEKLLEREVHKLRIEVTDAEVERIVESTKAQHSLDDQKLRAALAQQGLTLAEYKEGLKKQLMKAKIIQLKVKNRVQVTDQDVKSTYAKSKAMQSKDFRVRARHILFLVPQGEEGVDAKSRADAAKRRLDGGEEFGAVANQLSEDPGNRGSGGSLGVFGKGEMVPEFEKAAFAAEPGKAVGPVRTAFGWHLILVEERVAGQQRPLEEVEQQVRDQLFEDEVERAFHSYIEDLRKQAHIDIRD
jgi:peptidyl-prolyl cis-trans isomerase SurA